MAGGPSPAADLGSRALRGIGWVAGSQALLQVSQIVVAVVLARLLAPHDYGVAGMVLVFSTLGLVFSELALGSALVQRADPTERDRSTVFWTSVGVGSLLTLAAIGLSGPLASFYGEPQVQPLFAAMSITFVVSALGGTHAALLIRDMNFRVLELRMVVGTLAGAGVGIGLAAHGYGPWAIIGQHLTVAGVSTVLLWLSSKWRPRFTYSLASLRDLGGFGANVFATRLLFYGERNADNLLVGRFLGPAALGSYSVAYNLMLLPLARLVFPVHEVLFPALSRLRDQPRQVAAAWLRVTRLVGAVSIPAMLGMIVVAPDFVHVVLGTRWADTTRVLQVLAVAGLFQSLVNTKILQALDRTRTLVRFSVVTVAANIGAFVVGLHWGIVGVATGYAISNALLLPLWTHITGRPLGVSLRAFAANLAGVVQAALGMAAAAYCVRQLLVDEGVPPSARLAIVIVVGVVSYLQCCAWLAPGVLDEPRRLRRGPDQFLVAPQPSES